MEITSGITWQTFVFLVVAAGAFGFSGRKVATLLRLMRAHRGKDFRLNKLPERVGATILNVLGQKAVLKKPVIGIIHTTIFWGFMIITIGTLEQFASTLYGGANFEFIGETAYSALVAVMDFFTAGVFLAVVFAAVRRFIVRPKHLGQSSDANIILLFTGALMVSIMLMNGFHILAYQPAYAEAFGASLWISHILAGFDFSPEAAANLGTFFKWVHMAIVLGFAMYIPSSKHLHVLAAGPNTFFKTMGWEKGMKTINFEDESVTQYGAGKVTDMSWKDALDYYSCTECGRCQEVCPAWNTKKPLSPKKIIHDLKMNLYANKEKALAGKHEEVGPVIDANVTEDVIWACTSCRACEVACPVFIEQTDKIYSIRRNLVMMESKFPAEVQTVFKNMETNATPWAFSAEDRDKWADGADVPRVKADAAVDHLLWVGCAGSYDDRAKKVMLSFVSLLKKADVNFAILGKEEKCTGDSARRIGNEYLFQTLAKDNVATLAKYNIKKIITTCPHCFNTLKNEYPDFGGQYEVFHHTVFLSELVKQGKLKPNKQIDEIVAYHDSCYMGRWNGKFEEPRNLVSAVTKGGVTEMKANHERSMCCGAGGGRMWMEEKIGDRVNVVRTEQALETGASVVAANCPFCITMLVDGLKAKGMQDKVKVKDVAELLDEVT